MYVIAWYDKGIQVWEIVSGEDAMQIRFSELDDIYDSVVVGEMM